MFDFYFEPFLLRLLPYIVAHDTTHRVSFIVVIDALGSFRYEIVEILIM
jgi:hypothetical protein